MRYARRIDENIEGLEIYAAKNIKEDGNGN